MITPFDAADRLDEDAAAALMHHLVGNGSDGLVMAGTTGEASTLDDDEKIALFRLAVAEAAAEAGVDAVLAVTPYYNRPPRNGLVAHFRAIASVGLPVILYNIPSRTTLNMTPDLIAELGEIENVIAVKQANPELAETRTLQAMSTIEVYAGNDDMLLDIVGMGGAGGICVASHLVGGRMQAVAEAAARGDAAEAERIDASLRDLYAGLFVTTNPILVKAALEIAGLIPSGRLRLPLVEATPVQRDILRTVLDRQGLLARA
jgi:4-hydroxy-tetrahydrodipicolinate synthase